MRAKRLLLLLGAVFGLTWVTAAVADPRDAVDRSQRLDTDALRDDVATDRLRTPGHPLVIAPEPQPAPVPKQKKRSSAGTGSNR